MRSTAATDEAVAGAGGYPHLLAIKSNEKLWAWTENGPLQVRADRLAAQVEETAWLRHITLAMLAHAYLAVVRHHAAAPEWAGERELSRQW